MTRIRRSRVAARAHAALLAVALAPAAAPVAAQQVADSSFAPALGPPAFPEGRGPRVALDEAHHNFHTLDGRYYTFGQLLGDDGYDVVPLRAPFTEESLLGIDVLVVANALSDDDVEEWVLPTPSAFTPGEVRAVRRWVESGGGLLLIADHMPFPGAAQDLAAAFGFTLLNGFAVPADDGAGGGPMVFRRSDGSLADHPVTRGGDPSRHVDSVATFTGEALQAPGGALSLLTFSDGTISLNPDTAWVFHEGTHRTDVSGWSQGAVLDVGRGRVAVFGEAAMFSAQLAGPERIPMGMNAPVAARNPAFLLNLVRWLSGEGGVP